MRSVRLLVTTLVVLTGSSAWAAFPDDPPNDPDWAGQHDARGGNVGIGTPDLFAEFRLATDAEGASGMSADLAWREGRAAFGDAAMGRPDVFVAYMEGGINWHAPSAADILPKIYLNRAEIEGSTHYAQCPRIDNGDPWYNSLDFAHCLPDANGNGLFDAEDAIVFFSDGDDDDNNGYADDISGWDFYNDQNDPATVDSEYVHCNNQMARGAAAADDGFGRAGICPRCMIMPVKEGAEAIERSDEMAQAFIFAVDSGAKAFISETADLGYSSFMRQAIEHTWRSDVPGSVSTNDFDSTDHQGGMFWPHVIGCNSVVASTTGIPALPGQPPALLATSFRRRSGQTSWGTKQWVSVSTDGGSTSASCGVTLGVLGLLQSWSLEAADRGYIAAPLSASEVLQVLRASASDIAPPDDVLWPVKVGWDLQTGYGRVNLRRAQQMIAAGNIPPQAWFLEPRWYALYDPTRDASIRVTGHVSAPRSNAYDWKLEWAAVPGGEPTDAQFQTLAQGHEVAGRDGVLGTLPMAAIESSFYDAPFAISDNRIEAEKHLPASEQYTVTLRLRVTDAAGRVGEERRTVAVHRDPTAFAGFPRASNANHTGLEGGVKLADLQGRGHMAILYADMDGYVHALDPLSLMELPGWPVTTDPNQTERDLTGDGFVPRFEPVPLPIAVGDLDGDGRLWVVVTTTTGRVYAYDEHGLRRAGWPRTLDEDVNPVSIPRSPVPFSRPPVFGAATSPVLHDMDGDGRLEIVQSAWDGHIHIFRGDGTELPGWPVKVELPSTYTPPADYVTIQDEKLDAAPVIVNLDADPEWELVIRTQQSDTLGTDIQPAGLGHAIAYDNDGTQLWMTTMASAIIYHGSAQEFITEGTSSPVAADIDGDGRHEVAVDPVFAPSIYVYNPDGTPRAPYTATSATGLPPLAIGGVPVPDAPVSFTTSGAFGKFGAAGSLSFAQAGSNALSVATGLLTAGSGEPIVNVERAFDAATGASLPGFPAIIQGLNFLGSPLFVDVSGDGKAEILDGADSSAFHGFDSLGMPAPGFPKFTSGWMLWSATAGDLDSDGTVEVLAGTREGYLMAWQTAGLASANSEWWTYRHDEWHTGRYGADTRPPGSLRAPRLTGGRTLAFTAPGDDWYAGQVASYRVISAAGEADLAAVAASGDGESLLVPDGIERGTIHAVDDAGNIGRGTFFDLSRGIFGGQPLGGRRLLVTGFLKPAKRTVFWGARDPNFDAPDGADKPTVVGATVTLRNPATGESADFWLPPAGWRQDRLGRFIYRDVRGTRGPVRGATINPRGKRMSITARGSAIAFTVNEQSQGALEVSLTSGLRRYCTLFGGRITRDWPGRFNAVQAPPPSACEM